MCAKKSGGLGRGLGALIADPQNGVPDWAAEAQKAPQPGSTEIAVRLIDPNPDQPRHEFDPEALALLAGSLKQHGVLQPLLLAPAENGRYRIIAGERRWRAAKLAKLKTVPALIRTVDEREQMELALIENLQRQDLNPIEEALAIRALMDEFSLTQEAVAERVGRSRPAVANVLRLLNLSKPVQQMLSDGTLTPGQARPLAALSDAKLQEELAIRIRDEQLSARAAEQLVKKATEPEKPAKVKIIDPELAGVQESFRRAFGTKVSIRGSASKGVISVEYYSKEDLERIYEMIALPDED